jgi:flagella basal body P-ring formation protein FlgA
MSKRALLIAAVLTGALALSISGHALAAAADADTRWQSLSELERIAQEKVSAVQPDDGYRRTVRAQAPDPRLRLAACASTPEAFLPNAGTATQSRQTVGIRCQGPVGWTVYLQVEVQAAGTVVVLARSLARGERIAASDLQVREQRVDHLRQGWFSSVDSVLGRRMLRPLNAGSVLTPSLVDRARDIEKGQRVELRAAGSGINVGMPGEALSDASRGDRVRVRNLSSDRIVEGVVRSAKVVEILLN